MTRVQKMRISQFTLDPQPILANLASHRKENAVLMGDSADAVHKHGHRAFIGGSGDYWDLIGRLQFDFLISQGLTPDDNFFDIACGSLRAGVHFAKYLNAGRYHGLDQYIELIIYGVMDELGSQVFAEKRPRFVISKTFEFEKFDAQPSFAIAQSLFTHLTPSDISLCLRQLANVAPPGCRFFATFFETDDTFANPADSHSHGLFRYTRSQMESFGHEAGWESNYIGDWNHPRAQRMMEFKR